VQINVIDKKPEQLKADLYLIPTAEGGEIKGALRDFGTATRKLVEARITKAKFKAEAGKVLLVQTSAADVAICGLGKESEPDAQRVAIGKGIATAAGIRAQHVAICVGGLAVDGLAPVLEGALLGSYRFDRYKSKKKKKPDDYPGPARLTIVGGKLKGAAVTRTVSRVRAVCDAVVFARDLINEMSTVKTPTYLARQAKRIAQGTTVRCEVWQGARLRKERMNGILAVSAGSSEPGAFIRMVYKPRGKARSRIAVVGKGITFDSGGLSLKPAKSMEWMKQDMSGAAAVLGLMKAVAAVKPNVEVRGYVAAAENMPGEGAQKPGDIITYRNGTTAEVLNTDAEGRLVLGDALCVATEDKPDCIIDLATLTGACMVALGTRIAGIMGTDQKLIDALIGHGKTTGEEMWQLPLAEKYYMDDIRSWNADIKNIGSGYAGTITAALFLKHFVGATPWAHLDIAGPAFAESPMPYSPKGGTGYGVRTLVEYITSF
jgi:leucyl aminopeptidase